MSVMAMLVAIAAAMALRKKRHDALALALTVAAATGSIAFNASEVQADVPYTVLVNGTGNPASVVLAQAPGVIPVNVQNQLGGPVVVTGITVNSELELLPSTTLAVGTVIQPGAVAAQTINVQWSFCSLYPTAPECQ